MARTTSDNEQHARGTQSGPDNDKLTATQKRILICGFGCVGQGTYRILYSALSKSLEKKVGTTNKPPVEICVWRRSEKPLTFLAGEGEGDESSSSPLQSSIQFLTCGAQTLLENEVANFDIIVEVMGGKDGLPLDVVRKALSLGKIAVTANKALVAENLPELKELLQPRSQGSAVALEAQPHNIYKTSTEDEVCTEPATVATLRPTSPASPASQAMKGALLKSRANAKLFYEACVCGGIPIISVLGRFHSSNRDPIRRIEGIVNGSTNYFLTALQAPSSTSEATPDPKSIIKRMQDMGYLEANPATDLEGVDAAHKIAILARMAFGVTLSIRDIFCTGIHRLTTADILHARRHQRIIKLLATTAIQNSRTEDHSRTEGKKVCAFVIATYVKEDSDFARCDNGQNLVRVESKYAGKMSMSGSGAGAYPTGHAVASDVLAALRGDAPAPLFDANGQSEDMAQLPYSERHCIGDEGCFLPTALVIRTSQTPSDNFMSMARERNYRNEQFDGHNFFTSSETVSVRGVRLTHTPPPRHPHPCKPTILCVKHDPL